MGDLLAVYGTLRRGGRLHDRLGTATGRAVVVGAATIAGDIYEVASHDRDPIVDISYPCLDAGGDGRVVVELYDIVDPSLWGELDELEGFDPDDLDNSEYHRRLVRVHDVLPSALDATTAWTYVYVLRAPDAARRIAGGDWINRHG